VPLPVYEFTAHAGFARKPLLLGVNLLRRFVIDLINHTDSSCVCWPSVQWLTLNSARKIPQHCVVPAAPRQ